MTTHARFMVVTTLVLVAGHLGVGWAPVAVEGATCVVGEPSHPTIQAAVDDASCTEVLLASSTYVESVLIGRTLTLQGESSDDTVIQGQVQVTAGSVVLNLLRVDTTSPELAGRFTAALAVAGSAEVHGVDLAVVNRALLFGDGFESGNTAAWSAVVP